MTDVRIELVVSGPDEETLRRCREIVGELKNRYVFPTIGAELTGAGPVWHLELWPGSPAARAPVESVLSQLRRDLHTIDPDWPEFLSVELDRGTEGTAP